MWDGYRPFKIERIVIESESAKSFYLSAVDGKPLAPYKPGQHMQFRVRRPGEQRSLYRFYTMSDCNHGRWYRLTIKRELPPGNDPSLPPGAVSNHFHDTMQVGDIVEAKSPTGDFFLEMTQTHPVVFIAGGIGVTPLLAMINAMAAAASKREVYFFQAVRHGGDHCFKDHLRQLAARHKNLHLHICYDQPREGDRQGVDFDWAGRVDRLALERLLPTLMMDYYICGPTPMMDALVAGLEQAGVSQQQIHTEAFGPASSVYRNLKQEPAESTADDQKTMVSFARSGKNVPWDPGYQSLLQFAQDQGVNIESGCLYGDCATCMTRLLEGQVAYNHKTIAVPDPDACLPCSCKPQGSVTLDA